jgi:hypothetical protein
MSAAALTPRVRILAVCEAFTAHDFEENVFTLEGVRQQWTAEAFPCWFEPSLYLLLSSPRLAMYRAKVLVVNERNGHVVRHRDFRAAFDEDGQVLPLGLDLGGCRFPEPGLYTFQVWLTSLDGQEALKAEHPFRLLTVESEL